MKPFYIKKISKNTIIELQRSEKGNIVIRYEALQTVKRENGYKVCIKS